MRLTYSRTALLVAALTIPTILSASTPGPHTPRADKIRVAVSLDERRLWVIRGTDTLHTADVAVGRTDPLEYKDRTWKFTTPKGTRIVHSKTADPVWSPPFWHYVEVAREHGLKLKALKPGVPVHLSGGRTLIARNNEVDLIEADGSVGYMDPDLEIVFDDVLYAAPEGSINRKVPGELGKFRLDMGDGILMHGTPDQASVGRAATHGCLRLRDDDIEWMYDNIPVGTRVTIF